MSQGPARRMTSLHFKPIAVHSWAHSQAQAGSREEVKGQLLGATTTISHAGVEWAREYNWESVPRSRIIMLTWQKNSSGFFRKRLQKNSNKVFANPIFWRFILILPNTSPLSPEDMTISCWHAYRMRTLTGREGWPGGKEMMWDREDLWAWRIRVQVSSSVVPPPCQAFIRTFTASAVLLFYFHTS